MRLYDVTESQLNAALGMSNDEAFQASQALQLTHDPVRGLYHTNQMGVVRTLGLKIVNTPPEGAEHLVAPHCIVNEEELVARGIALWLPRPENPETGVE